MDTCVRSGLFDEALDVVAQTNTLQRRHARLLTSESKEDKDGIQTKRNGYDVIRDIAQEVQMSCRAMRDSLLAQLCGKLSLPVCLHAMGHLKRSNILLAEADIEMKSPVKEEEASFQQQLDDTIYEQEHWEGVVTDLRVQFLRCRDQYLRNLLASVPRPQSISDIGQASYPVLSQRTSQAPAKSSSTSDTPPVIQGVNEYAFLVRVIEHVRVTWFDVVTQYLALFDEESVLDVERNAHDMDEKIGGVGDGVVSEGRGGSRDMSSRDILKQWICLRVTWFLKLLSLCLPLISDAGSLSSILEQAMYLAESMGRVEADFRGCG